MNSLVLLAFLGNFVAIVTKILVYAIIFRIVISWFSMGQPFRQKSWLEQILADVTDPVMKLVQRLPHKIGMIDLSPMMAIIGLEVFAYVVISSLNNLL